MTKRRFVVTAVSGHTDVTSFSDLGPRYIEVVVSASNNLGEHVEFRRPLADQPHVGDVVEFDEVPDGAIMRKELG